MGVSGLGGMSSLDMDMPRDSSSPWSTFDGRIGHPLGMGAGVKRLPFSYLRTSIEPPRSASSTQQPVAVVLLLGLPHVQLSLEDIPAFFADDGAKFLL